MKLVKYLWHSFPSRYWEGRKIWSTMTLAIRTLTRSIWVMVNDPDGSSREVVEKASAINLLLAFSYATKNYLREEYSYDEDVNPIILNLTIIGPTH